MTKVSIIVPFHNVENYISQCIDSLVNQTLKDIEIIFVDDASDDDSKLIVQRYMYEDDRISLLNTESPSGQSFARNMGLKVAKGEYIGFVDSDDWVKLDMFEKMYNRAKEGDADITMCQAQLYDDKEKTTYTNDYYSLMPIENLKDNISFSPYDTKDEILNINVVLWNKIYKKEFLQEINAKFQDGFIYEDLPFFFETYLKAKRVNILWESLYYYRQNRLFSTMQNSDKKVYDRIPMVELTYNIIKNTDFFNEKKLDIVRWVIDDIFHRYTLLEDKYYEDYYSNMKKFFSSIELTDEEKEQLDTSYCYDEFCNIIERSYYGFWQFLIEKYKTTNKLIKTIKHEHNESMRQIHEYWDNYSKEKEQEKKDIVAWWNKHYEEDIEKQKEIVAWWNKHYDEDMQEQKEIMQQQAESYEEKMTNQEYDLKAWQAESVRQVTEKITADYEWKLQEQQRHWEDSLQKQKYYYENNYLLVKIMLKICRKAEKIQNTIKNLIKKN